MTVFPDSAPLGEAREWLREQVRDDGAKCPCCSQFAKVYRRKLNSGMARSLIRMYLVGGRGWVNITTDIPARSREEGKLPYWELAEPHEIRGIWRVTELGERWVKDMAEVPRHAEVYDGRCLRLLGDPIRIREALGAKFDYDELMRTPGTSAPGF